MYEYTSEIIMVYMGIKTNRMVCLIQVLLISFQAACSRNIQRNCSEVLNNGHNENAHSDFLEGQVISCLQQIFLKNEKDLFPECKRKLE